MKLFKLPSPPQELECQPEERALATREALLDSVNLISEVKTAEENDHAALCGSGIRKLLNEVEATRKELTAPYLAAQRMIKKVADEYSTPLLLALDRLSRLTIGYRQEQERQAEEARRKRAEEIARLQEAERQAAEAAKKAAESNDLVGAMNADIKATAIAAAVGAAIVIPPPTATKTAGQSFQEKVLGWECTDVLALWNARPDLCEPPKPKASAIRATCAPERPIPGLKLWWESKVSFKSR